MHKEGIRTPSPNTQAPSPHPVQHPRVSVVICTLNEANNIVEVLPRIPQWIYEVLVVDGRSTDGTVETCRRLRGGVRILVQTGQGKGDALRCGIRAARGDIVVTMDADGSTDPLDIPRFLAPLLDGCNLAKGTRFANGLPRNTRLRILGNLFITAFFDALYLQRFTDVCSGYLAFWTADRERLRLERLDSLVQEPLMIASAVRHGLRIVEVPHVDRGRLGGTSKMPEWSRAFRVILALIAERFGLRMRALVPTHEEPS